MERPKLVHVIAAYKDSFLYSLLTILCCHVGYLACFFQPGDKVYLAIDRTIWFWGKRHINILVLAVAYEGLAIPIYWKLLNGAGNSNSSEQIAIIDKFAANFGASSIEGVLADREFASQHLISYLVRKQVPFYFRIKRNAQARIIKGSKSCNVVKLFKHLQPNQQDVYPNYILLYGGNKLRLAGSRAPSGELMIILTNANVKAAISIYLRRWEIENLFQGLKGRGFRLEDSHMTDKTKISKLIAVLAIGFCWAHKSGEMHAEQKPIRMKRFKRNRRPQNSYFRYGLDFLRDLIVHWNSKKEILINYFKFIIPHETLMEKGR